MQIKNYVLEKLRNNNHTIQEITKKLEFYCAYQERCHDEVIKKIKSFNVNDEQIDLIIVHLIQNNFLNEERFALAFARGKHNQKQWGRLRIVNELKLRNISKYNIDKALKEITLENYLDNFDTLAIRKWETIREANIVKKKKKLADFLLRKGFENQLVHDKINELKDVL